MVTFAMPTTLSHRLNTVLRNGFPRFSSSVRQSRRSLHGPRPIHSAVAAAFLGARYMFRYGSVITVVSGTHQPDHLFRVVECLAEAGCRSDRMASIVIASVRPHSGLVPGDIDRWFEASAVADAYGLELKEWFVVSPAGVECARELVGEPERW
jgi:hypothetical protein